MKQHRIATIQDLSCFGKCSLTVAVPLISAMGLEVCPIPTAILSTHTSGFSGWTFRDLSEDIPKIIEHWKKEGLTFDAVSTGYLGSVSHIGMVSDFFDTFPGMLRVVDPVMADHGKLYTGFTLEYAAEMTKLCGKADVIVPNLTEAAFMLNEPYIAAGYDEEYIHALLRRLTALGCPTAVVTGIIYDGEHQGAVAYDSKTGEYFEHFNENIDVAFHGTGDIFTSALAGALTLGLGMQRALEVAVDYTVDCIRRTMDDKKVHWYGVKFEESIPFMLKLLSKCECE